MKKIAINSEDKTRKTCPEDLNSIIDSENEESLFFYDKNVETDNENSGEDNFDSIRREIIKMIEDNDFGNESDGDDEDDKTCVFVREHDADDYHNDAVMYSRLGQPGRAAKLCVSGLQHFPHNIDLIADVIQYSSDVGDMITARKHFLLLKEIPFKLWNWRAFMFSISFLIKDDPVKNAKECRRLVNRFKKILPNEEKSYLAESDYEDSIGNKDNSLIILKEAVNILPNAAQCAVKLADRQFDYGLYDECINTTTYGISASADTHSSINEAYLVLLRVLSKDHLIHQKACRKERVNEQEICNLTKEYHKILDKFPKELSRYKSRIETRMKLLDFIS